MHRFTLAILATLTLIGACGRGGSESGTAQAVDGVTDTEIVLGTHTDLSGPVAILGVDGVNGARMRFDEANEAGGVHGRKIRFIVEDTQYQVPKAIQAANKLINRDKIFAMVMALGTPTNNAVLTQQLAAGIPNLFPITGARSMVEPFNRLTFHARGIYYDEIRAATKYFVEVKGSKKPCAIYQDTDYGQEIYEAAIDQTAAMGMKLVAASAHKPSENEFTAAVLRLKNAGCDLVLMGTIVKDTILILETARKMDWHDVAWVGNNAAYNQAVADQKSGAAEGYYAFVHMAMIYRDNPRSDAVAAWWDKYIEKYGRAPEYMAFEAYRNADLVVKGLENAGRDLSRDSLIAGLEAISDYEDVFGYHLSFGPNDHKGVSESTLSQVRNGRWHTLAESITY